MIQRLINRYKRIRTERFLAQKYQCSYAFVGMGQHSLTNLYPVLQYLGVPLKYICVTSERKARLIEQKYRLKATTSLETLLNDDEVKGIFVSASPSAHFSIASQILQSGKSLFVEKPPCLTLAELDALIDLQRLYGSSVAMVGLQKRYAPPCKSFVSDCKKSNLSVTTSITSRATILRVTHFLIYSFIHSTWSPIFLANPLFYPASRSPKRPTSSCSVIPKPLALSNSLPPTAGLPPRNTSKSAHQRAFTASHR